MTDPATFRIKLFADGANRADILRLYTDPAIRGFTTNPTLMAKAGIRDYRAFAIDILQAIPDRPVSFEVFADEFSGMERQAHEIAAWGENVYVKIPITNTRQESAAPLIASLSHAGVRLNITAILTLDQVRESARALEGGAPSFVSVFAGRIADTGRDPIPFMSEALEILRSDPAMQLIWASPREVLNIVQAECIGCHIITATPDILAKLPLLGRNLAAYSLETVRMFYNDAARSGFEL